jgi:hypothetical protein
VFRTADFRISKPMFAANLDAYSIPDRDKGGMTRSTCVIAAVWFQRKRHQYNGPLRTAACGGFLNFWMRGTAPADAQDVLSRTSRQDYTAHCLARWDGETLWSLENEETRAEYKALLVPMLEAYPAVPPAYSGWWWFGNPA